MSDSDVIQFWFYLFGKLADFLNAKGLFDISFLSLFAISTVFCLIVSSVISFQHKSLNYHFPKENKKGYEH